MNDNLKELKEVRDKKENLEKQLRQLNNQLKKIENKDVVKERKARTKRLIERGAMLESLIPHAVDFNNEEIQEILIEVFNLSSVSSKVEEKLKRIRQHNSDTEVP